MFPEMDLSGFDRRLSLIAMGPDGVHILCYTRDWYKLPPILRYALNMAATRIAMADCFVEQREYRWDRFPNLCRIVALAKDQPAHAAEEIYSCWFDWENHFGVVHLDVRDGHKGDLILGDDPNDHEKFVDDPTGGEDADWVVDPKPHFAAERVGEPDEGDEVKVCGYKVKWTRTTTAVDGEGKAVRHGDK